MMGLMLGSLFIGLDVDNFQKTLGFLFFAMLVVTFSGAWQQRHRLNRLSQHLHTPMHVAHMC